jgi:hypothetical protein
MPVQASRKLTLADAMLLVAAVALGSFLARETNPNLTSAIAHIKHDPTPGMRQLLSIEASLKVVVPFLAVWTPALLLLRLRQPRPCLKRLARQPGAVASAVATLAIAIVAVWILSLWAAGSRFMLSSDLAGAFLGYSSEISFAVAGGWSVLAFSGRWRSEPSWIDRTGRATGVAWIATVGLHWSKYFLV